MAPATRPGQASDTKTEDEPQQQQQSGQETGLSLAAVDDEEEYNSEEDADFDLNNAPAGDESEESEAESETLAAGGDADGRPRKKRKVAEGGVADEDFVMGELESGDEATIREGKRMKERKKKKSKRGGKDDEAADFDLDDEPGAEGLFVKTRGMKNKMYVKLLMVLGFLDCTNTTVSLQTRREAPSGHR
jgi:hypothetical protein